MARRLFCSLTIDVFLRAPRICLSEVFDVTLEREMKPRQRRVERRLVGPAKPAGGALVEELRQLPRGQSFPTAAASSGVSTDASGSGWPPLPRMALNLTNGIIRSLFSPCSHTSSEIPWAILPE